jgi:hypothetical protein
MGGKSEVNDFYRLYFAPGVNHRGGGYGPVPTDPLDALVAWVEHGTAPETLLARSLTWMERSSTTIFVDIHLYRDKMAKETPTLRAVTIARLHLVSQPSNMYICSTWKIKFSLYHFQLNSNIVSECFQT